MIALTVIMSLYVGIGALSAVGSMYLSHRFVPAKYEPALYSLFLIPVACLYLAFTSYFGEAAAWSLETVAVLVFAVLGILGTRLPVALISGYALHGVWDLLHEIHAHTGADVFGGRESTQIPLAYGLLLDVRLSNGGVLYLPARPLVRRLDCEGNVMEAFPRRPRGSQVNNFIAGRVRSSPQSNVMKSQLHRRQFLKLTSAASLTAPLILSSAWGDPAQKGPNDRITLGFIGTGTQGRGLLNNFLNQPDTQVLAVCDVDTTRREHHRKIVDEFYSIKQVKEYKGCAEYREFQDLLARKDIDAVVIAVPDHWHAFVAIAACKAGKDVYCEKPLSLTIHEARAMVKAARKYDRVFQTGSMQRSMSEFRKACELVRNGRIGKISQVIVDVGPPSKPCDLPEEQMEPGLNWDMWLGPAPLRPYNSILSPRGVHQHFPDWRNYREYSGGMMTDWGAHHFDIAQWGLGMDDSGPVEIIPPEDPKATKGLRYLYANGVEVLHGDSGGVLFIGSEGKILVNRGKFEATPKSVAEEPLGDKAIHLYNSYNHGKDFLDCIRSRKRPICDVEIGCRSVTVCHLGNLAYWNHRHLKWDPAKESFIGDSEANKWLDRPKRGDWNV